jgi:predicted nucleotidyltransferase
VETVSHDLAEVKRIVLEGLADYDVRVYLFGSHSQGTETLTSDIDVAILPLEPLPIGLLSGLREELEESLVLQPVDLVDLSVAEPAFRQRVMQEGILWSEPKSD